MRYSALLVVSPVSGEEIVSIAYLGSEEQSQISGIDGYTPRYGGRTSFDGHHRIYARLEGSFTIIGSRRAPSSAPWGRRTLHMLDLEIGDALRSRERIGVRIPTRAAGGRMDAGLACEGVHGLLQDQGGGASPKVGNSLQ